MEKALFVMPKNPYEYTELELKAMYMKAHPDHSESKARRAAAAEYKRRQSEAAPHLILDIHDLRDPTCGEAEYNLRQARIRAAAARRVAS